MKTDGIVTAICSVSFILCASVVFAGVFKLPDTGQTKCYQKGSPYNEIPCEGAGQDGTYIFNPKSYTDNGDGTVMDNNTGLMWQKQDDGTTRAWATAGAYCEGLTLGGHSDWRLPTKKELITIVDYSVPSPGPTINPIFKNTKSSYYWASTTYDGNTGNAWSVNFYYGYINYGNKGNALYTRCVRGGQPVVHFYDNGDDTVSDGRTGLIWQKRDDGVTRTWGDALLYCERLNLAGRSDWRLPNIIELESLTDDSRHNPAIDPVFAGAGASYYWSSTTNSYSRGYAWFVSFGSGSVYNYNKPNSSRVRCVSGQSGLAGDNCSATLSEDLSLHIPVLSFMGQFFLADFSHIPDTPDFGLAGAGVLSETGPFDGCAPATLSSDLELHIPALIFEGKSYWMDMIYSGGVIFSVTGAGEN